MKTLSNTHLLLLSALYQSADQPLTGYEIMIKVNHFAGVIDQPYSPGALYPALNRLLSAGMINNNHIGFSITQPGRDSLAHHLAHAPIRLSISGILVLIAAAQLSADSTLAGSLLKRLDVEMIKFNHSDSDSGSRSDADNLATTLLRERVGAAIRQLVIELRAKNKAL